MDKESAQRGITTDPTRTVDYRAERQRAGVDVIRVQPLSVAQPTPVPVATHEAEPVAPRPNQPDHIEVPDRPTKKVKAERAPKAPRRKTKLGDFLRPAAGAFGALLIIGITGYVAFDTYITNNVVRKTTQTTAAVQGDSTEVEGSDESEIPESSIKSYAVAADMPRLLKIDSINVKARILPMGVTAKSAIKAPVNIFDAGWYTGSAKPGTAGISFIDAHASGATREGLFAYLDTVKPGDTVSVERGDGQVLRYAVRKPETQKLADIDMTKVLSPQYGIKEGLTIMTCTGKWMADKETYDQRVIVYTERI